MSAPRIGVLAVQGDVREHTHVLQQLGAQVQPVRRAEELAAVQGLVIPGGESSTMDKLVRAFGLFEPLRERIAAGMPVYGTCAGMIMLADRILDAAPGQQTLGGLDVTVRRNAFGRQVDSFEAELEVSGIVKPERPMHAVFIRAPWIEEVGADVEVLARVASGEAVVVRRGNLLASSFHPEVTEDHRLHALFLDQVSRDRL